MELERASRGRPGHAERVGGAREHRPHARLARGDRADVERYRLGDARRRRRRRRRRACVRRRRRRGVATAAVFCDVFCGAADARRSKPRLHGESWRLRCSGGDAPSLFDASSLDLPASVASARSRAHSSALAKPWTRVTFTWLLVVRASSEASPSEAPSFEAAPPPPFPPSAMATEGSSAVAPLRTVVVAITPSVAIPSSAACNRRACVAAAHGDRDNADTPTSAPPLSPEPSPAAASSRARAKLRASRQRAGDGDQGCKARVRAGGEGGEDHATPHRARAAARSPSLNSSFAARWCSRASSAPGASVAAAASSEASSASCC